MQTDVAVVVVTYNSADMVGQLLETIPAAMGHLRYRIVVVDNGSSDATVPVLRGYPDVLLLERANHGYSAGINAGVAAVPEAETILVLNPDVRLHQGAAVQLVSAMRRVGAGIVAPKTLTEDGVVALSLRRAPSLLRGLGLSGTHWPIFSEHVYEVRSYDTPHVVEWAVGAALLISRDVFEDLGGWDESYFLYSEETDFCLRAADRGHLTFYEPSSVVVHIGGASGRSSRTQAMQTINRVRLYARRHGPLPSVLYLLLMVLGELRSLLLGSQRETTTLRALLLRRARPAELQCSDSLIPR